MMAKVQLSEALKLMNWRKYANDRWIHTPEGQELRTNYKRGPIGKTVQ
jgi:hypothetical protein